jgi:simple sugar transport system substrate-binding protein/ribose transport system substrate-binding protein
LRVGAVCVLTAAALAACGSSSSSSGGGGSSGAASSGGSGSSGTQLTVGVALTLNNTDFWSAYIGYEKQYASQMGIKLLGPEISGSNAATQNQQVEELVNQGAKAIIVNPETATSLGPAISYASAHGVKLVSVDTIVGVGKVYMVVRASNVLYGQDACAEISSKVKSGYVLDLEGDLTSSNGADRTNSFNDCMKANAPAVHILSSPTVWVDGTAVTDAQNAINAHGSDLKAIYVQWSPPDTGIVPILQRKHLHPLIVSDDGVPFEMCDVSKGTVTASQSQPANLYAKYALVYAKDAAEGKVLKPGMPGGGGVKLSNVSYKGDSNLGDPVNAPFVTKTAQNLTVAHPVEGLPASATSTAVTDKSLWGNQFGASHGGVCSSS